MIPSGETPRAISLIFAHIIHARERVCSDPRPSLLRPHSHWCLPVVKAGELMNDFISRWTPKSADLRTSQELEEMSGRKTYSYGKPLTRRNINVVWSQIPRPYSKSYVSGHENINKRRRAHGRRLAYSRRLSSRCPASRTGYPSCQRVRS